MLSTKKVLRRKCVTGLFFWLFDCSILNYTSIGVEFHVIEVNPKQIMAPAHVQHIFYVKQFKYTNTNVKNTNTNVKK